MDGKSFMNRKDILPLRPGFLCTTGLFGSRSGDMEKVYRVVVYRGVTLTRTVYKDDMCKHHRRLFLLDRLIPLVIKNHCL